MLINLVTFCHPFYFLNSQNTVKEMLFHEGPLSFTIALSKEVAYFLFPVLMTTDINQTFKQAET